MRLKVRLGATNDGIIKAIDIKALSDTGAYGEHASTTIGLVGEKLYQCIIKLKQQDLLQMWYILIRCQQEHLEGMEHHKDVLLLNQL